MRRIQIAPQRCLPGWLIGCALAALAGCATAPDQTKFMSSVAGVSMSTSELRARVLDLGRRQTGMVGEAVVGAWDTTRDPATRRAAMTWGLAAVPDVQAATLNPDPLVSLADLWALALQTQTLGRSDAGRGRLGRAQPFVERAGRQMADESERLGAMVFGPEEVGTRRQQIEQWARTHPISAATFARPAASVAMSRALIGRRRGALSAVASMEDRLDLLGARMEMMNATLLDRIRWTGHLLVGDSLGTEDVAGLMDRLRAQMTSEYQHVLSDLVEQRRAIFAQLDAQRRAAFADVARERAAIFTQVDAQRTALTAQGEQLLQRADASARALLLRVGLGAAVLIVLAAVALWIVWRTSRPSPRRRGSRRAPSPLSPVTESS